MERQSATYRPRLLVIDAMSQIFRAFFALQPPSRFSVQHDDGEVEYTNAVYGFTTIVLRVIELYEPEYVVVAFDTPGPNFRDDKFEGYKANRAPPPDELVPQFDRVRQMVDALGIPSFALPGFEADDILGRMAVEGVDQGMHVLLMTSDRDAYQLIGEHVNVVTTNPRNGNPVVYDMEKVADRWGGLRPEQIIGLKALQGDASDNIPGVQGIGEKTAIALLNEFGDLESIIANTTRLSPRARKALEAPGAVDMARLSFELATIVTDLPIDLDISRARIWQPDHNKLGALLLELRFNNLGKRLPFEIDNPSDPNQQLEMFPGGARTPVETQEIESVASANRVLNRIHSVAKVGVFGVIKSTDKIHSLLGLGIAASDDDIWYVPVQGESGDQPDLVFKLFRGWLEDENSEKESHNAKDLIQALAHLGIDAGGFDFDSAIAGHLLSMTGRTGTIEDLVLGKLGINMVPRQEDFPKGLITELDAASMAAAAGSRAAACLAVGSVLRDELTERGMLDLYERVEMPLVRLLAKLETIGVAIDVDLLESMSLQLSDEIGGLEDEIYKLTGRQFTIGSPKQLGVVLFEELGLPNSRRTKSGQYSTAKQVLDDLRDAHPIVGKVLEYRELSKLKSTYVEALPQLINRGTGRVHTTLSQTITSTGRLSSNSPNLQNIPIRTKRGQEIRKAFKAGKRGYVLMAADYSQIELRVLAHIANDESMIAAFMNDEDIHRSTAAQMFNVEVGDVNTQMRRVAKTTNFGIIYGITSHGLAARTNLDLAQAAELIDAYFGKYPAIKTYMENTVSAAQEDGYVTTLLNRRRYFPDIKARGPLRQRAERESINMPIQGTAADIMKIAMLDVDEKISQKGCLARMIMQVHDELLFELPEEELNSVAAIVDDSMRNAYELIVPLKVDISWGSNWADQVALDYEHQT